MGIPDTPGDATSSVACQSFPPQTPAPTRIPPRYQQISMHGTKTPQLGVQQTRSVPESPITRSTPLAGQACLKGTRDINTEKEPVNFLQTSVQDNRTSQTGHQDKTDAFNAPCSNSSPQGRSCHQTDVRKRMEPPSNQGVNVQKAKGPQDSPEHKVHDQEPPKAHAAAVTVQDHSNDLKKQRSKMVHVQHSAERNTGTSTPALRHRKTVPEITEAPANPKWEAVLNAPVHPCKDKSLVSSSQVVPKPADMVVEYPSVSEMRNMDIFYNSAWVLGLQRKHQELLMEEIKAQITYKPADRFSIMSAFEDDNDPFMGHKSRSSSLPYRTLDEELLISTGSSSSSPASQDIARHTGTKYSTKRQSSKGNIGSKDSSQCSKLKTMKRHSQRLHQHIVSAECTRHVARGEVVPASSEMKEATILRPLSLKEISKQKPSQENVSPSSDKRTTPSLLNASGASESESGTQLGDVGEQCTLLSSSHSGIPQQACANEFDSAAISCKPSLKQCRCGELKVDKACQAQPDVSTVSTSYDA